LGCSARKAEILRQIASGDVGAGSVRLQQEAGSLGQAAPAAGDNSHWVTALPPMDLIRKACGG